MVRKLMNQPLVASRAKLSWPQENCQSPDSVKSRPKDYDDKLQAIGTLQTIAQTKVHSRYPYVSSPRSSRSRASTCCSTPRDREEPTDQRKDDAVADEPQESAPLGLGAPLVASAAGRIFQNGILCEERSEDNGRRRADLVNSVACLLGSLVSSEWNCDAHKDFACFDSSAPPEFSLNDYLGRLSKYFGCSDECFILASAYISELLSLYPSFLLSPLNVHKLVFISLVCAAKFWDDDVYDTKHYAYVGGVEPEELKILEAQFLAKILWRLHICPIKYEQHHTRLLSVKEAAHGEFTD